MSNREFSHTDDTIDVRDVIARFEEITAQIETHEESEDRETSPVEIMDLRAELTGLEDLLSELKGAGGDEQWRGDWYPITLIRESYFEDYARELADDIGAISRDAKWPNNHIDWEAAADELKSDYSTAEFSGETFYFR
jgi:antirestriction protein